MSNGTLFIDVGEDPDAFLLHENNLDMRMPHVPQIQNLKMENVGAIELPAIVQTDMYVYFTFLY